MTAPRPAHRLIDEGAPRALRLVALSHLDAMVAARARLDEGTDPEALHDLRVALRRLRSHVRAYRDELEESLGRKQRDRLADLARATGASRDAEVHLAWLHEQESMLSATDRPGLEHLIARVQAAKQESDTELRGVLEERFDRLERSLRKRLERYSSRQHVRRAPRERAFAAVAAGRVAEHGETLRERLSDVRSSQDREAGHAARIAGKRLRYVLEPLAEEHETARALVARLKELQDGLGDLHDTHVFATEIARAVEAAAALDARRLSEAVLRGEADPLAARRVKRRDPRAGLLEIAVRLHKRGEAAYAAVSAEWSGGAADAFHATVRAFADELRERGARRGVEIERKYLLASLPEAVREVPSAEIDQGYVPGEKLLERLRRVRDGEGERYYRTVKGGQGLSRLEVEEETSREIFTAMWPLTKGRRLTKRRHFVRDGELTWEIDAFTDRDLVLAEIELPDEDHAVEPPEWLAPHVVREVTEEPDFANSALAR